MLQSWVILPVALAYLGALFAIAYLGDARADRGRSIIANPTIYALSLGVYATAWTFYGSVGRAATDGIGFLPIYIGPTIGIALWWLVLRKILRISKTQRITSLGDFVSSRYGKSALLAGLVTVIAVVGVAALHRAAAQGRLAQLHDPVGLPRDRAARAARAAARERRPRVLDRAGAGRVHDRVRDAPPRRRGAPRGHGGGDRVRVRGQAGRLPRDRRVRDLRPLRRPRATSSRAPASTRGWPRCSRRCPAWPAATPPGRG